MKKVIYSNFCSNPKSWIDGMQNDNTEVIIRYKKGKDLVLISFEEYNSLKETLHLLSGENRNVLLNSINQLEAGTQVKRFFK